MDITSFYKILFVVTAYLFGAFPTGYVIHRFKIGGDIRDFGSGNVGGTNVTRTVGVPLGVTTMIVDIIKGFIPILVLCYIFPDDPILLSVVTVVVILGHDFPIYIKFKGGKGIATSFGVIIGVSSMSFSFIDSAKWIQVLPIFTILMTAVVVFLIFRIVSLGSLSAALATPLSFYFTRFPLPVVIAATCWMILALISHRVNIKRLIRKEEKKIRGKGV